jgi:hypothetical protein
MKRIVLAVVAVFAVSSVASAASSFEQAKRGQPTAKKAVKLTKTEMSKITAGSSANFPPGRFPSGNPAQAPGQSNPNTNPP